MLNADLHSHSTVSDGVLTPDEVARRAHSNGVQLWSLTDHDDIDGQALARQTAEQLGMRYISGVEISVTWLERTVHIIGLNIDPQDASLNAALKKMRDDRQIRGQEMGQKLADLGFPGTYEGALQLCGNPDLLSRTHFARYMIKQCFCKNMQEVFDRYLGDDKIAYVGGDWISLPDCVECVKGAGGVAVIAHPGRYKYSRNQFNSLFHTFKAVGGMAIEVNTGSHSIDQYQQYAQVAKHYGFLASVGSDFHSPTESRMDLGKLKPLAKDLTPVWELFGLNL